MTTLFTMPTILRQHWITRTPVERNIMTAAAAAIAILLYAWLVMSLTQARGPLQTQVSLLRTQAAQLEQQAIDYRQVLAAPPVTNATTSLQALVQAQANQAGLASALSRIDAPDAQQLVVVFGAVAFTPWLHWISDLQAQHVRVATCRIEALSSAGLVSVTATLVRVAPSTTPTATLPAKT
ncbi:MAG TPA: type II secretion system protein GspM [Pseudomonadales bacterium]|nr:type II secretion system protein GspM [Pseudomonadales bacterium]